MSSGLELILSSIYCNGTTCHNTGDDTSDLHSPNKLLTLAKALNGKHLKIATYNNYPISWTEKMDNGTVIGDGVAFVVMNILREKFNFTYDIVLPGRNYEIGGDEADESVIGLVNSSKVDMAAAFLPRLPRYEAMVTFSTSLDEGVWMMMLKRPRESAAGSGLLAPFETQVWYMILAAVLCYGPCIMLLTHFRSKLVRDAEKQIPLSVSFWFVYGAFIKQGTNLAPEANATRVLFATWWVFIILLSAFYTANLTAFLTLSKFTLDIVAPEDLVKKNYRWIAADGGSVETVVTDPGESLYFLYPMVRNGRGQFLNYGSDREYLPAVRGGAVLVGDGNAIEHLMYADYQEKLRAGVEESQRCTYVVAPQPFMTAIRAFAFPVGSDLVALFSPVLKRLYEAGIMDFLKNRDLPTTRICPLDLQSKDRKLRNSDLTMTFMIMIAGLASASAVFIMEIILKRMVNNKVDHKRSVNSKRRKHIEAEYDGTAPPPYETLFGNKSKIHKPKKKIVNGREYWVFELGNGNTRLVPLRTPSALLYQS